MVDLAKREQSRKWETIRRLRYGALIKLFRDRWGHVLPDDDAGRGDLWLLLQNVSLARADPDKKMRHVIELWAPWLPEDEAKERIEFLKLLTIYERTPTARDLGERLRLTNAERQRLKLWPFKPIDATDEELAMQSRARRNERKRAKRGRTRAEYLASCLSATKPWEAEGISRSQWYRRHATSPAPTIVIKAEATLVASVGESQKGHHESAEVVRLSKATKASGAEGNASSSSALWPHLSHEQIEQNAPIFAISARALAETDPQMAWAMLSGFLSSCEALNKREAA